MIQAARTTASNIKSNSQVFWVSIFTIAVALSILGLFLIIFVNLNSFLATWSKQVQLIVYLDDHIPSKQLNLLKKLILKNPDVESVTYITREEAWKKFKNTFSRKSSFLSDLEFNPLPGSYNIKIKPSPDRLAKIRQFAGVLKDKNGVESVEYGEKWIGAFEKFMIFIRVFLLAVGGILSLGLIFIISNTIKLSFYSRKDETELMLLIGATHRFVRVPFLIEGVLQGLLGAMIGLTLIKSIQLYLKFQFQGSLESITRGMEFQFLSQPLILALLAASAFIGWVGSHLSINQFLESDIHP